MVKKKTKKTTKKKITKRKVVKKKVAKKKVIAKPVVKEAEVVNNSDTDNAEEKPLKFAFFVGCTTRVRLPYIEKLSRDIFAKLNVELIDLEFSCCPTARIAKDVDEKSWLLIAARNLALAEKEGLPMLSMCTGCTQTLMEARHELEDIDTKKEVNKKLAEFDLEYKGEVEIKFYAQLIHELQDKIKPLISNNLNLRIATHSGCHILRPSKIMKFDDPENPTKLDELVTMLGADPVDYQKKPLCCGFPIYNVDVEAAKKIMKDKISMIDADCMFVVCPTCFEYYELHQKVIANEMQFKPMMIFHFMQLLGIAMGYSIEEVGYQHLRYKEDGFLEKFK
jgi:heterodisulfide reductase subunit B2